MMKRISLRTMLLYSSASLGAGLFFAFTNATLPLYLDAFTHDAVLIGLLASLRSIIGSVVQPVVGTWSDGMWTRWGRRKPFILAAIPLVALLFLAMALIPTPTPPIGGVGGGWLAVVILDIILFSVLFNAAWDPYVSLMPDITPVEQRGMVSSLGTVLGMIGQVGLTLLAGFFWESQRPLIFSLLAVGLVLTFGLTFWGIREERGSMVERQHLDVRRYLTELWGMKETLKYYGVWFLLWFGFNAATPFLTLFAVKEIHVSEGTSQLLFLLLVAATAVFAVPVGLLGDRLGRKRILGVGLLLLSLACLAGAFSQTLEQIVIVLVVVGLGNAASTVLIYPILTELVPAERIGEFTGLSAIVQNVAIPLSVLVAGGLINLNLGGLGYRSIFLLTGGFVLASLLMLQTVRLHKLDDAQER